MKALRAYFKGWSSLLHYKQMWLLMYVANFILAFLAAIPVSGFLGNNVGHSLSLERSLAAFDYIFLYELMNEYSELIYSILNQSVLFVALYFLAAVFLQGGLLQIFKKDQERFSFNTFLKGCSKYFWQMLRLTIYFLLFQAAMLFFFFLVFASMSSGLSPFEMESEKQMIDALMILVPIYILAFTVLSIIHDYTKIHVVHQNPSLLFKTIREGFVLVFKNIGRCAFLYLLNILTLLLSFVIYWFLKGQFDASTMFNVFAAFIIIQFFVIARIGTKLLNLSSATHFYKSIQHP